jgi:hypothetical protein
MNKEEVIKMGYEFIGEVDGLELYTNINSEQNINKGNQGYIFQFNQDYKEAIGQIYVTKKILENLVNKLV